MNLLKLVYGLQCMVCVVGVIVYSDLLVIGWIIQNGLYMLCIFGGSVMVFKVIVVINGYILNSFYFCLFSWVLLVYLQIIVIMLMLDVQVRVSILIDGCLFDMCEFLFYYCCLLDNCVLFGGCSVISGVDFIDLKYCVYLYNVMVCKFFVLVGIGIDYWWGGWVVVMCNFLLFFYQVFGFEGVFWGGGYVGLGVFFLMYVGMWFVQMVVGLLVKNGVVFLM